MWWKLRHRLLLLGVGLLTVLLAGCSSEEVDPNAPQPTVTAQLNFSLPVRIAGLRSAKVTRMTSDIVQIPTGEDESDFFRGIDDVHLLCFDQYPMAESNKLGGIIEMKTSGNEVTDEVTEEDYSLCQEISIPVGTSYFAFYASAPEELSAEDIEEEKYKTRHEKLMHFGAIETIGLGQNTYQGNSGIRFRPLQICSSDALLGGSATGQALLQLLNDLMDITGPEAAPNDKWATVGNPYMNEAYQRMTQFTTLSSYNVQVMLGFVLKLIHAKGADDPEDPDGDGQKLRAKITEKIISCCLEDPEPDIQNGIIVLKDDYQGFPADIHLPDGAARIKWNAGIGKFEVPDKHVYSEDLNVTSVNDYVYPINLQYQVFSDILASDKQVMYGTNEESGEMEVNQYRNWDELLNEGYENADRTVNKETQSVAMVKQVNYAVGRLTIRSKIGSGSIYDAHGKYVNVSNGTFTLKGYIIGGQREVDYNFLPVTTSRTYAIYDTDMGGGPQDLKRGSYSEPDYILGLGTQADQPILVALELVNNGADFQGADGIIVNGATFYLVANLNPQEAKDGSYVPGSLDKVFIKDHATQVNITINSLANATYGLPNLDIPRTTFGLSVNLGWGEGLYFEENEL